jgi:[ribosomal protein S18]-alanine N-acetyltransferase
MSAVLKSDSNLHALRYVALDEVTLPRVVAIESSVYAFPWTTGNFRDSLYSGYDCTGVWHDGELVGYCVSMPALEEVHLLNLAVALAWQRRSVGAAILQNLIDQSRAKNREVIYLEVRPTNIAALRLYERFGFQHMGVRRDYYPSVTGREDALFLGLNLKQDLVAPTTPISPVAARKEPDAS